MSSSQAPCPECRRDIAPPDKSHRYCPYCGVMRVQMSAGGGAINLGSDVCDPGTGEMLAYATPHAPPTRVHPVKGPHRDPSGSGWRDLFGASGMAYPTQAHGPFDVPHVARHDPPAEAQACRGILGATARQRSFYVLLSNGQLWGYSDTNLQMASEWSFPKIKNVSRDTRLFSTFSLVAALSRTAQLHHIEAFDLVQGKQRIELHLQLVDADACFAGDSLYVLGLAADGEVRLLHYPLSSFEKSIQAEPTTTLRVAETPPQECVSRCRIIPTDHDLLLVLPNGRMYTTSQLDPERPRVLWPNGWQQEVQPSQRAQRSPSGNTFMLIAGGNQPPALLEARADVHGTLTMPSHDLVCFEQGDTPLITSTADRLYYAYRQPSGSVEISSAPYERPWDPTPLCTLPGTAGHRIARFEAVPYQGGVQLLVLTLPTDHDFAAHFHLVHPQSGQISIPRVGKPSRDDRFEVAWTAGRLLLLNLDRGLMQWL